MMKKNILLLAALLWAVCVQGQVFQLPNPGFEQWDGSTLTGNNASEPTGWNTFQGADGSVATGFLTGSTARQNHHAHRHGGRPGSTGSSYLTIWSKSALGIVANGNMTTGRIHIGSTTASNLTANYNYTDRSSAGFNQPFHGTPDSISVWLSYWASSASSQGSFSCYLHGNSNFQDPNGANAPATYRGRASAQISRTQQSGTGGPVWQQVKVPFIYDGTSTVEYILLTFNTNTIPAGGSAGDSLSIDDIEFIYSSWLNGITLDGQPLEGFQKGVLDYTLQGLHPSVAGTPEASDATVTLDSAAFSNAQGHGTCYTLHVVAEDQVSTHDYHLWCYQPTPPDTTAAQGRYQVPNSDFEQWSGPTATALPQGWSSFSGSDGPFASLTSTDHHYRRAGGRPGTQGSHFLTVYTDNILSIRATGIMTNGRIHAGAMSLSSPDNYNYTQRTDANHCTPFTATPDSMYVWVSYYATDPGQQAGVAAYLHGDNDFRYPTDQNAASLYHAYALATTTRTSAQSGQRVWQELRVPFVYNGTSTPNYMLVSIVSCTVPGGGDYYDSLSVDDLRMVYSSWLTSATVDGQPVAGFRKGQLSYTLPPRSQRTFHGLHIGWTTEVSDATVTLDSADTPQGREYTLRVVAEDGETEHTYRLLQPLTPWHTVTALSSDSTMGSVSGSGVYDEGSLVTLAATPGEGYYFRCWNDSVQANPRTLTLLSDTLLTALFAPVPAVPDTFLVTALSAQPEMGSVSGGGRYEEASTAILQAHPAAHHHFEHWNDGVADNPLSLTVTADITLTAHFAIDRHEVTLGVIDVGGTGTLRGAGLYDYGTTITIEALPDPGSRFVHWDDGDTTNPRTLTVEQDTLLMAYFDQLPPDPPAGIHSPLTTHHSSLTLSPNPTDGELRVESEELSGETLEIFDLQGRCVLRSTLNSQLSTLNLSPLPAGVYTLRCGGEVRRVVKQ